MSTTMLLQSWSWTKQMAVNVRNKHRGQNLTHKQLLAARKANETLLQRIDLELRNLNRAIEDGDDGEDPANWWKK